MQDKELIRKEVKFARATGKHILLKSRLPEFLAALDGYGYTHQRQPTGLAPGVQVVQVSNDGKRWEPLFYNKSFRKHYTVPKPLAPLLQRFLAEAQGTQTPWRRCEHCGAKTQDRLRECCAAGRAQDQVMALDAQYD